MDKILIVDGSSLLFQSFFGMPKKIKNKSGKNIEAVICFVGILNKTIKYINPTKLLIVFDGETKLERKQIDKNYKDNRKSFADEKDEDNPFLQLEIIKNVLDFLKYCYYETTNCEADDYIASITNLLKEKNEIIISSQDKDFYQLISNNVKVFSYRGKQSNLIDEQFVQNKYGFEAKYFTTLKSLIGDNSDNISGAKGIGIKTATKLIKEYGDLENILLNTNKLPQKIKEIIENYKQKLLQNYFIIDLKQKCDEFDIKNLEFVLTSKSTIEILNQLDLL